MKRVKRGFWRWLSLIGLGLSATLSAQTSKPAFEVASVRIARSPFTFYDLAGASPRVRPGGVFDPTHITVATLIQFAYGVRDFQVTGGPDWVHEDVFEVNARAGFDAPPAQVMLMVQSLLEERFKLVTHVDQREMRFLAPGART